MSQPSEASLWLAVINGQKELVIEAVEAGISPDCYQTIRMEDGKYLELTPLLYAVIRGDKEMVETLRCCWADEKKEERTIGGNAFNWAVNKNRLEILKRLLGESGIFSPNLRDKSGVSLLIDAVETNNVLAMKILIERGADINLPDKSGDTPLHYAAHGNRIDALKLLLEKGADTNVRNEKGKLPVHYASFSQEHQLLSER